MSRKCSNCGAPAPDSTALFCNRCGSRLPASETAVPACRTCGKPVTDRQSLFCDRCGSPLAPAAQAASPARPAVQRRNCPACGFENVGENLFYCRKCGTILPKYESVSLRSPVKAPTGKPQQGGIHIIPDGMDDFRQEQVKAPVMQQPTVDAPAVIRRPPPPAKAKAQAMPRKPPREAPKPRDREYWRRVSIRAAWILLILLIIAAIALVAPGILQAGSENTTSPGSPEAGPQGGLLGGIIPTQTPVIKTVTPVINPGAPVINQGTPVVRDTPLLPNF